MRKIVKQASACIGILGFFMYSYLSLQNDLTHLRIQIPKIMEENRILSEEVAKLQYEVDHFEDPSHLMYLAALPQYSHLSHPYFHNIVTVPEGLAVKQEKNQEMSKGFFFSFPLGKQ